MIQIYSPGNENYSQNGDTVIEAISGKLKAALNSAWSYTLVAPIDDAGRWKYIIDDAVIKAPSLKGLQLYRIKKTTKTPDTITAEAWPIGMDCKDGVFLRDVRPTKKNGQAALDDIFNGTRFTGSSNITKTSTAYYYMVNALEAINGNDENAFIKRWGGELFYDNYTIFVDERIGADRGFTIAYGKNIPVNGFSEIIDFNSIVTRIYPTAFNGRALSGDGYVDSPLINNYPTVKVGTMQFEDVKLKEDAQDGDADRGITICNNQAALDEALRAKVQEQWENGLDKPTTTINANMVMLKNVVGYEEYQDLTEVLLGDTIHCKHSKLGIVSDLRVIELEYDSLLECVTSVKLGQNDYQYFANVSSAVTAVNKAITPGGDVIGERIRGFIDGALAQLRLQNTIAKKQDVRAILFEDLDESSPTYGAMALGTQGFQISKKRTADGQDWVWSTFGTADGFNADLITAGEINALDIIGAKINGGTINGVDISGANIYSEAESGDFTNTVRLNQGKLTATRQGDGAVWNTILDALGVNGTYSLSGGGSVAANYNISGLEISTKSKASGVRREYDLAASFEGLLNQLRLYNATGGARETANLDFTEESFINASGGGESHIVLNAPRNFITGATEASTAIANKTIASGTSWVNLGSIEFKNPGIFRCTFLIRVASNATGRRAVCLSNTNNGGPRNIMCQDIKNAVNGQYTTLSFTINLNLSTATTLYLNAYQNSGSSLEVITRYTIERLGGKVINVPS